MFRLPGVRQAGRHQSQYQGSPSNDRRIPPPEDPLRLQTSLAILGGLLFVAVVVILVARTLA